MSRPCGKCPFRTDLKTGYLTADRIQQITASLYRGESFPCHETTESCETEDGCGDRRVTAESCQCAGAEIFLHHQGLSTQLGRIAARLGLAVDLDLTSPVCRSVGEMLQVHGVGGGDGETEGEPCSVCDDDCQAPAGLQTPAGVVVCQAVAPFTCYECGFAVCAACSRPYRGRRVCTPCLENYGDD